MKKITLGIMISLTIIGGYTIYINNSNNENKENGTQISQQESNTTLNNKAANHLPINNAVTTIDNIMWAKCALGQQWQNDTCTGNAQKYNFTNAQQAVKNSTYADFNDWRLPTIDELHSLVVCSSGQKLGVKKANGGSIKENGEYQNGKCLGHFTKPTINTTLFPNFVATNVYSSTPNTVYKNNIWILDFGFGYDTFVKNTYQSNVLLVRDI